MKTVTLTLPDYLDEQLQDTSPEVIIRILEAGLPRYKAEKRAPIHPYITRIPTRRGGRPIIRDTGITVSLIARLYKSGDTVDDILENYPHLEPAWVYDAISYYLDYQEEIERDMRTSRMEQLTRAHNLTIDERGFVHFPEQENAQECPSSSSIHQCLHR